MQEEQSPAQAQGHLTAAHSYYGMVFQIQDSGATAPTILLAVVTCPTTSSASYHYHHTEIEKS